MKFIYEYVLNALAAGERAVLVTVAAVEEGQGQEGKREKEGIFPAPGSKRFFSPELRAGTLGAGWLDQAADELAGRALHSGTLEKARVFGPAGAAAAGHCLLVAEPFFRPDELVILGAGHIARPLVQVAAMLGYAVTVVDDRPEFASRERFPEARQVICADFEQALESLPLGPGTSVVIVTRGHQHDLLCLERLIGRDLAYLGMIGSRRKVKLIKEHLLAKGVPEERIAAVYMPIGLDLGAQTPEEIAVSIAAELIKVRRGGGARSLAEDFGGGQGNRGYLRGGSLAVQDIDLFQTLVTCVRQGTPAALATVIAARGSSPRKAGAKMLIFPDGSICGTIGGGLVEEEVRRAGLDLLAADGFPVIFNYSMDNATAAAEGMICGGAVEVLIEPVSP